VHRSIAYQKALLGGLALDPIMMNQIISFNAKPPCSCVKVEKINIQRGKILKLQE